MKRKKRQKKKTSLKLRITRFLTKISIVKKAKPEPTKIAVVPEKERSSILIYESELQAIGAESSSWDIETGGDLFGIWDDMPIVYLATRTGPNSIRERTHFRLDVPYLIKLSDKLQDLWKLRYFGDWHSHHTLGLEFPSVGDQTRIKRVAAKNNFIQMAELVVTFCSSKNTHNRISIHPYIYSNFQKCDLSKVNIIVLKGISPVREALLANSLLEDQRLDSFAKFPIRDVTFPKDILVKIKNKEENIIHMISEKLLNYVLAELKKVFSGNIELHHTKFGYIFVIPVKNQNNIALAIEKNWPHKVLQVDWMDRSCGKSEELSMDLNSACIVDVKKFKKIIDKAMKIKNIE